MEKGTVAPLREPSEVGSKRIGFTGRVYEIENTLYTPNTHAHNTHTHASIQSPKHQHIRSQTNTVRARMYKEQSRELA